MIPADYAMMTYLAMAHGYKHETEVVKPRLEHSGAALVMMFPDGKIKANANG